RLIYRCWTDWAMYFTSAWSPSPVVDSDNLIRADRRAGPRNVNGMGIAPARSSSFTLNHRMMADDFAFDEIDHVLGDVGGVIGDALQLADGREERHERRHQLRGLLHVANQFRDNFAIIAIYFLV